MAEEKGKTASQGNAVILPNGERRVDYIRDQYYEKAKTRSEIRTAINDMYTKAKQEDKKIAYQIVFAATKQKVEDYKKAKAAAKTAVASK